MSDKTGIEWTDATWNPIRGCSNVDLDCRNCYAEKVAARFSGAGMPYEGTVDERGRWSGSIRFVPEHLADPLRWQRSRKVFVNSMSDIFHEGVSFEYIAAVFGVMAAATRHTFQVLTKRPERAKAFFDWLHAKGDYPAESCVRLAERVLWGSGRESAQGGTGVALSRAWLNATWPLPNVLVGTSVGYAKALPRIDALREVPAALRFLSLEPLHGPLGDIDLTGIGWVIVGGESGPGARPMHPAWVRSIRDQCVAAGVPFFFKQWGEWMDLGDAHKVAEETGRPENSRVVNHEGGHGFHGVDPRYMLRVGKRAAGRTLDGRTWDEHPVAASTAHADKHRRGA